MGGVPHRFEGNDPDMAPSILKKRISALLASRSKASPQLTGPVPAPEAVDDRFLVLESCHSTWLFDEGERRFCRVLKGDLARSVSTEWRPYDRLVLHADSDAFVVFLDQSGSRLLRSWRHTAHCERCGGDVTAEMSLEELHRLVKA